jgi:integrase
MQEVRGSHARFLESPLLARVCWHRSPRRSEIEPVLLTRRQVVEYSMLESFRLDWILAGKAPRTADAYVRSLTNMLDAGAGSDPVCVRTWVMDTPDLSVRRKRGQAVRALGAWCDSQGIDDYSWWRQIPLAIEKERPQVTVVHGDYVRALQVLQSPRDRTMVELLWWCGLRRTELAMLRLEDIDFVSGSVLVRQSKTGKPRMVPVPKNVLRSVRRLVGVRTDGLVLEMSSNAIRLVLQRAGLPSAHAWRRGWAVNALSMGVSEASVRAAAGWSSGEMVSRYTRTLAGELAVNEFGRVWGQKK